MSCLPQNLLYHFYYSFFLFFFLKTYCYPIGFGYLLNAYDAQKYLNLINLLKTCYLQICKRFLAQFLKLYPQFFQSA